MKLTDLLPAAVLIFVLSAFGGTLLYTEGFRRGHEQGLSRYEERSKEDLDQSCFCGATRTCAFGTGIVGIQRCGAFDHRWTRCEPDAAYLLNSKP